MTKVFNYILLAEGKDYLLIERMLDLIVAGKNFQFVRSKIAIPKSAKPSSGKIMERITDFANIALIEEKINLLIIGVDLDLPDHTLKQHEDKIKEIEAKIPQKVSKSKKLKTVKFSPVQAIEAWLFYQSNSKKHEPANSVEKLNPGQLKRKLYGSSKVDERKALKIIERIDFSKLADQSKSFALFYHQILDLIEGNKKNRK